MTTHNTNHCFFGDNTLPIHQGNAGDLHSPCQCMPVESKKNNVHKIL